MIASSTHESTAKRASTYESHGASPARARRSWASISAVRRSRSSAGAHARSPQVSRNRRVKAISSVKTWRSGPPRPGGASTGFAGAATSVLVPALLHVDPEADLAHPGDPYQAGRLVTLGDVRDVPA